MLAGITPHPFFFFVPLRFSKKNKKFGGGEFQHVTPLKISQPPPLKLSQPLSKNVTLLNHVDRYHHLPPHPFLIFFVPFLHFSQKYFRGEHHPPLIRPCCQLTMIAKNSTHVVSYCLSFFLFLHVTFF